MLLPEATEPHTWLIAAQCPKLRALDSIPDVAMFVAVCCWHGQSLLRVADVSYSLKDMVL